MVHCPRPLSGSANDNGPKGKMEQGGEKGGEEKTRDPTEMGGEQDAADEQRRAMRVALARRMKRDLIERERERLAKV